SATKAVLGPALPDPHDVVVRENLLADSSAVHEAAVRRPVIAQEEVVADANELRVVSRHHRLAERQRVVVAPADRETGSVDGNRRLASLTGKQELASNAQSDGLPRFVARW